MSKSSHSQARKPSSFNFFDWLYAEHEEHLKLCFVPMPEFDRLRGDVSILVFGEPGSGKTALYKAFLQECFNDIGTPNRLLVTWHPVPSQEGILDSTYLSRRMVLNLLDACALALTSHLAKYAEDLKKAPEWASSRLFWFIRNSIHGDLETRLGPILSANTESGDLLLLLQNKELDVMFYDPSPEQMILEALIGLKEIGMKGIWVMGNGFEGWAEIDPDQLGFHLKSFLSALSLLDLPNLNFKFVLPTSLEVQVKRARGATSRRLISSRLDWTPDLLQQIVEKRLSLTFDQTTFSISDLCDSPGLLNWLKRVGNTPRQWLGQLKPLVDYYLKNQLKEPITDETWKELRAEKDSLPELWVDENGHHVKIGGREITLDEVSPQEYNILRYLYRHSGEVVGKDALYFLGYLGLTDIPRTTEDKNYASPNDYTGLIDTIIHRLRQAIEPDPSSPVLLQTIRGHGVRLQSR